jgi:hypothetical protein
LQAAAIVTRGVGQSQLTPVSKPNADSLSPEGPRRKRRCAGSNLRDLSDVQQNCTCVRRHSALVALQQTRLERVRACQQGAESLARESTFRGRWQLWCRQPGLLAQTLWACAAARVTLYFTRAKLSCRFRYSFYPAVRVAARKVQWPWLNEGFARHHRYWYRNSPAMSSQALYGKG